MKFVVFLIFACLSVCYSENPKLTLWGQVTPRILGTKSVEVPSSPPWESKNYTLFIPEVNIKKLLSFQMNAFACFVYIFFTFHFFVCKSIFFVFCVSNLIANDSFFFRLGTIILPNSRYPTLRFYVVIHSQILGRGHRSTQCHSSNYIRTWRTD